jgi:hypothetical protein
MKRLTLFAVLAASLLAWAAPADATSVKFLFSKTDSIWARIGGDATTTNTSGSGLSEVGKYRHFVDSTGMLKNCGDCTRYWAEVTHNKNPNAGGTDSATVWFVSMRNHPGGIENDTTTIDLGRRPPPGSATVTSITPQDTAMVFLPLSYGTDSTAGWCEWSVGTTPNQGTLMYTGHRTGARIDFETAYLPRLASNPSFKWRVAGSSGFKFPKLVFYTIRFYCQRGD